MARPREFEMGEAVAGALDAFWRLGYTSTNLPELLRSMGLSRGSFYKAFGDKRAAYLAALDHYDRTYIGAATDLLADRTIGDGYDRLVRLFGLQESNPAGMERGCFVCNAMVEVAPCDADVARKTVAMARRLEQAVLGAVNDIAELSACDPEIRRRKAVIVTRFYVGSKATCKTGHDHQDWSVLLADILGLPELGR